VYVVVVVSLSKAMSHVLVKEASWEIMITLGLIDRQFKPLFFPRPSLFSVVQKRCDREDLWYQKIKHVEKSSLCGPSFHRYDFESFINRLPFFFASHILPILRLDSVHPAVLYFPDRCTLIGRVFSLFFFFCFGCESVASLCRSARWRFIIRASRCQCRRRWAERLSLLVRF
jgi:hypothetical protein